MLKKAIFILAGLISFNSHAALNLEQPLIVIPGDHLVISSLNWNVGDNTKYDMAIGTFLKGSMEMSIKAFDNNGLLINQKIDLAIIQQECDTLIDTSTGEVKSIVCKGETQDPGGQDVEIIETRSEVVTVPAGTFSSTYVKALEKTQNTEIEQWVNTYDIPVTGLIKMKTQTQLGELTAELISFEYAN